VPEVKDLEASLEQDGSLSQVSLTALVPNGGEKDRLHCTFGVEDGVATLDKVTGAGYTEDETDLGTLWVGTHLPGILAAEMAVSDLEQIRDVVGLESLLDEAQTQAEYGYRFECSECGHKSWGRDAAEAESDNGLTGGCYCPDCGASLDTGRDSIAPE
jgi:hypothetical protein